MGMDWLAGIGSTVLGGIFGGSSAKNAAKMEFEYQKRLQQQNIDWEKEQWQNKNQWTVEDMRKAGLNPILAAGNTGSVSSAPGGSVSVSPGFKAEDAAIWASIDKARSEAKANKSNSETNAKAVEVQQESQKTNAYNADTMRKNIDNEIANRDANTAINVAQKNAEIANAARMTDAQSSYYGALSRAAELQAAAAMQMANSNSALNIKKGGYYDKQIDMANFEKVVRSADYEHGKGVSQAYARNGDFLRVLDGITNAAGKFFPRVSAGFNLR